MNKLPKRFSKKWWYVIGAVLFASAVFYLLYLLWSGDELNVAVLFALLISVFLLEPLLALGFELVAPNKVVAGPGDRLTKDSEIQEQALVASGFGEQSAGRVRMRGEDWIATQASDDKNRIETGDKIAVVDREGLKLIVRSNQNCA